jgi:hypothetical protein
MTLSEAHGTEPRCQHYFFAHYALRQAAFDDPLACLAILASPKEREFLASLWASVARHCEGHGEASGLSVEDVTVYRLRVGEAPCAVIQMPPPRGTTEAYFVAMLLHLPPSGKVNEPADINLRYFTLEKGSSMGGASRTVLCEWTKDGSHVNFGEGPEAELSAFIAAVDERLCVALSDQ